MENISNDKLSVHTFYDRVFSYFTPDSSQMNHFVITIIMRVTSETYQIANYMCAYQRFLNIWTVFISSIFNIIIVAWWFILCKKNIWRLFFRENFDFSRGNPSNSCARWTFTSVKWNLHQRNCIFHLIMNWISNKKKSKEKIRKFFNAICFESNASNRKLQTNHLNYSSNIDI